MTLIAIPDAQLVFTPHLFNETEADEYFERILVETRWQHQSIKCFGKTICVPRLTAWYGDLGAHYEYSGNSLDPQPWTQTLLEIKTQVEKHFGTTFNSVLLNRYRNGADSVDWHADDERSLGKEPVIASVSFGGRRRFRMKHRYRKSEKFSLELTNGSALLMASTTQQHWLHQLPKTRKPVEERINLTFRLITT
ncbi:MAG: alpha-ketoglutarate-dependent dioxygenase AlkB family protein [Gammaproteobacteria bacterium]